MTEYHNLHVRWALSLQPGDKVLTNWTEDVPEYQSLAVGTVEVSNVWRQVEVEKVWADDTCDSGFLVTLKDCDQDSAWKYQLDIDWIKPLPNPITKYIISYLPSILDYEEDLSWMTNKTNAEICEALVDDWFTNKCQSELYSIDDNMEIVRDIPVDFIPVDLFRAAIQTGITLIDWETVAADETIAERLKELRDVS